MLFLVLKKGSIGQNHCSPNSNYQIKNSFSSKNSHSLLLRGFLPLFKAIWKTLQDMEREENGMILLFKVKLRQWCTENASVWPCNILEKTYSLRVTRVRPSRKTFISQNTGNVTVAIKITYKSVTNLVVF